MATPAVCASVVYANGQIGVNQYELMSCAVSGWCAAVLMFNFKVRHRRVASLVSVVAVSINQKTN